VREDLYTTLNGQNSVHQDVHGRKGCCRQFYQLWLCGREDQFRFYLTARAMIPHPTQAPRDHKPHVAKLYTPGADNGVYIYAQSPSASRKPVSSFSAEERSVSSRRLLSLSVFRAAASASWETDAFCARPRSFAQLDAWGLQAFGERWPGRA
jgi:hypothetical protein